MFGLLMGDRRTRMRVMGAALGAGLLFWVLDASVDAFIFREGPFLEQFITAIPLHEIYIRLLAIGVFLLYGVAHLTLIEAKRRSDRARLASEEQFRHLAEQSPNMIFINQSGRVVYANEACSRIMGYTREEFLSPGFDFMQLIAPFDREYVKEAFAQHARGEEVEPKEYGLVTKGGRWITAIHSTKLITYAGQPAILGVVTDITELKETEHALRDANVRLENTLSELEEAQDRIVQQERLRALGQMASGIAHDFNNALMPILGYTDMLLKSPEAVEDRDRLQRYIRTIQTAAQDAANVVRRLRDFYRPRGDGEDLHPTDLAEIVRDAVSLTRPSWKDEAQARGVDIELKVRVVEIGPIAGDGRDLREMLTNLILNAVDALPDGGTIAIRAIEAGGMALLEVSDDGVGMTEEQVRQCMEPFFSTKGARGSGLGLSVVHGIVTRHNGSLEVESRPGHGTTFRIRIPLWDGQTRAEESMAAGDVEPVRGLRILLIDDEPTVAEVLHDYLRLDDHEVVTAADGVEGMRQFSPESFDLVITDRAMPGFSGDQVAAEVRSRAPGIPVIMLTGFGDIMAAQDELPPGVDRVLSKPIHIQTLRSALSDLMR